MFQFPRLPSRAYVFSPGQRRIAGAGFSHSEIHGSKAVQRLTVAYRSRPRPSSTPGAKASTVCPYYLDGEPPGRLRPSELGFLPSSAPAHRMERSKTPLPRDEGETIWPDAVFKVHRGDRRGL